MNDFTAKRAARLLRPALYLRPSERGDTCSRCARSERTKTELVSREHGSVPVSAGGICAMWQPVRRFVSCAKTPGGAA